MIADKIEETTENRIEETTEDKIVDKTDASNAQENKIMPETEDHTLTKNAPDKNQDTEKHPKKKAETTTTIATMTEAADDHKASMNLYQYLNYLISKTLSYLLKLFKNKFTLLQKPKFKA